MRVAWVMPLKNLDRRRYVSRACIDLWTNVGENNIERGTTRNWSLDNRNNGAMTAEMFAANETLRMYPAVRCGRRLAKRRARIFSERVARAIRNFEWKTRQT